MHQTKGPCSGTIMKLLSGTDARTGLVHSLLTAANMREVTARTSCCTALERGVG